MIIRIVRMEFAPEHIPAFETLFASSKTHIRTQPGCLHLEMHQDAHLPHVRYTYSKWTDEAALNAYRNSELFGQVWPKTKALFAGKPMAFSLTHLETVDAESSPAQDKT
ncbi:MAG: putative quinol monooxygenase [Bacteroidota bacterium]